MANVIGPSTDALFDRASDRVYAQLRRMIIALELAPGTVLVEGTLVEQLGCGRTPLREAILRLAEDDLVVALPRRAVSVADITVPALQQLYEARWELEPALGRLAAERISLADLDALEGILASDRPDSATSPYDVTEWDMAFHHAIAQAAENRYLQMAFEGLQGVAQRLLVFAYRRGAFVPPTLDEHRAILDALRARDAELAAIRIDGHIRSAKDRILRTL